MKDLINRLINGENIYNLLSQEDVIYFFKVVHFNYLFFKDNRKLFNSTQFMITFLRSKMSVKTPNFDPVIDTLDYKDVKNLLKEISKNRITFIDKTTIDLYNHLARRNNEIIKELVELSGEFHAYVDGILVETVKEI